MNKILVAEDDPASSKILEKTLKGWGYNVILTDNGQDAWEVISKQETQLAILDWMMPKIDGLQLCRKIRQEKMDKYTYVILLTSKQSKEDIYEGLSAGADDYISKPFHHLELQARINTGKRIIQLENRLLEYQDHLEELATRDGLTKLWNRRTILRHLEEELHRSLRESQPIATIMIDVDHFKLINDKFGHHTGDDVLTYIANQLEANLRPYDKLGRYGGDELLIVLPNCSLRNAESIAERLRLVISARKIPTESGLMNVTISLGVTSSEAKPYSTVKNMIKTSDTALYEAKAKGRDCVVISKLD
ncbi:MAG: diguanylate cyclase [Pseudomonadota bacterium]